MNGNNSPPNYFITIHFDPSVFNCKYKKHVGMDVWALIFRFWHSNFTTPLTKHKNTKPYRCLTVTKISYINKRCRKDSNPSSHSFSFSFEFVFYILSLLLSPPQNPSSFTDCRQFQPVSSSLSQSQLSLTISCFTLYYN